MLGSSTTGLPPRPLLAAGFVSLTGLAGAVQNKIGSNTEARFSKLKPLHSKAKARFSKPVGPNAEDGDVRLNMLPIGDRGGPEPEDCPWTPETAEEDALGASVFKVTGPDHGEAASTLSVKSTEADSVVWKKERFWGSLEAYVQLPVRVWWTTNPFNTKSKDADKKRATKEAEQALAKAVADHSGSTMSVAPAAAPSMQKRFEDVVLQTFDNPQIGKGVFEYWVRIAQREGDLPEEYRNRDARDSFTTWTNATQELVEQMRDNATDYLAEKLDDDSEEVVLAIAKTMLAKAAGPVQMKLEALRVASLTEDHRMQEAQAYDLECACAFTPFEGLSEKELSDMIEQNFATVTQTKRKQLNILAQKAREVTSNWMTGQVSAFLKNGDKQMAEALGDKEVSEGLKALLVKVGRQAERFYLGKNVKMTSWSTLFGSQIVRGEMAARDSELDFSRKQERKMGLRRSYTHLRDEALAMLGGEGLRSWLMEKLPKDTPPQMRQLLPDLAFEIGEKGRPFFEASFFAGTPRWASVGSMKDQYANVKDLMEILVAQAADSAGPWSAFASSI